VISANTGRYTDSVRDPDFALLRELGIDPPQGEYITSGRSIVAKTDPSDEILLGGIASFSFYTSEQQHEEARRAWRYEDFKAWPYRWLPETNYFGHYVAQHPTRCKILARFPDGGAAISLHPIGKGQVMVFWGSPDYRDSNLRDLLRRTLTWAHAADDSSIGRIPLMIEAHDDAQDHHFALLWNQTSGIFRQNFPQLPDGKWLLEDLVSDRRLGIFDGETLRQNGMSLVYEIGYSPLKVIRMRKDIPDWAYRLFENGAHVDQTKNTSVLNQLQAR